MKNVETGPCPSLMTRYEGMSQAIFPAIYNPGVVLTMVNLPWLTQTKDRMQVLSARKKSMGKFSGKSWKSSSERASQTSSQLFNYFFINRRFNRLSLLLVAIVLFGCGKNENIQSRPTLNLLVDEGSKINVDSSKGRFQLVSNPTWIIDTVTVAVWRATGPAGGPYYLTRVCYKSDATKRLMPTPFEDELLPDDPKLRSEFLSRDKEACS